MRRSSVPDAGISAAAARSARPSAVTSSTIARNPARTISPHCSSVHVVVRALLVALHEVAVVLRVVDRGLVVVARERLDGVERLPEREGDELGALSDVAPEQPRAAVAGRLLVALETGLADVRA